MTFLKLHMLSGSKKFYFDLKCLESRCGTKFTDAGKDQCERKTLWRHSIVFICVQKLKGWILHTHVRCTSSIFTMCTVINKIGNHDQEQTQIQKKKPDPRQTQRKPRVSFCGLLWYWVVSGRYVLYVHGN